MAEEAKGSGAAQNKLGELFVDIGSSGLGTLVKGLNSLSATFLLTKNAANQFIKPIQNIMKESGESALGLGKLNSIMGASFDQLQSMQAYFESKQLDPKQMIGDISGLQQKLYNISHGFEGIDEGMARAFNLMELDITDYNGDLESTLDLINEIDKKTKNVGKLDRAARLREVGLSSDWAYAFDRPDFNLYDSLKVSDESIQATIAADEAFKELEMAAEQRKKQIRAITAPIETNLYRGSAKIFGGDKEALNDLLKPSPLSTAASVMPGVAIPLMFGNMAKNIYDIGAKETAARQKMAAPPPLSALNNIGYAEPNLSDLQRGAGANVSISHTNYIQSTDPKEVPIEIMRNEEIDIQNIQYQLENNGSN